MFTKRKNREYEEMNSERSTVQHSTEQILLQWRRGQRGRRSNRQVPRDDSHLCVITESDSFVSRRALNEPRTDETENQPAHSHALLTHPLVWCYV